MTLLKKKSLVYRKIAQGKRLTPQERRFLSNRKRDSEVFVVNSPHPRHRVKDRIIVQNLLNYVCSACSLQPMWQSRPLTLVLDHINGINNDNRLKNLRFLCPNCNSQTKTFSRGHRRIKK